jgi:hypothetical protein
MGFHKNGILNIFKWDVFVGTLMGYDLTGMFIAL